ncbi:hypothetical protein HPP92_007661 [Vanilla planifolia]|uniref:Uncharacterized protein n=1 Tax=Vanilla planifolia TaxID=51239 RepID=A0A835RN71_VANPL|nr:hypothetical protein HPP92_007853 [Vanilla planifolia]KAG0490798.1 hypothetical protein HPP92_007661 [Vanilla planifolia]
MANETQWTTFDDDSGSDDVDEALSLSDLPVSKPSTRKEDERASVSPVKEAADFEFRILGNGDLSSSELEMCAAEDVFFHGQLLPLRSSARPVSRSDSSSSLGLDSGSGSSSGGSTCVSRSLSSNSCKSSSVEAPLLPPPRSISNTLFAHPSPSPRAAPKRSTPGAGRRSTGSSPPLGWRLLRAGLVKAPEMEFYDIRVKRIGSTGPNAAKGGSAVKKEQTTEKKRADTSVSRLLFGGLGCNCSAGEVDAEDKRVLIAKKKEAKDLAGSRVEARLERRRRMVEWLEELSLGKGRIG